MVRTSCLAFVLLLGCHGLLGGRTTDEDQALNNFAEARVRAATYYDGRDFERAAEQYKKALEYRPKHVPTRLGYAYSLMWTEKPIKLVTAQQEFEEMGTVRNPKLEVKRIYGLAMTYRTLAKIYQAQAIYHDKRSMSKWWARDRVHAITHADKAIKLFQAVLDFDDELAKKEKIAPLRVSASLTPDAHVGMAHCYIIKADNEHVDSLNKAIGHIRIFAQVAEKARRFWTMKRTKVMATDPLREGERGSADPESLRGAARERYERRILRTVEQEVAMRKTLVEVYNQLERYQDSVNECDIILQLDNSYDRIYWLRGQAHASLEPPNYDAALKDIEEYRRRTSKGGLTEELVRVNRWIKVYRGLLAKQKKKNAGS